jgi:uroporphyrinogen-III decarboxylase
MTPRERLDAAINLKEPDRVPVCPMMVFPQARHAGMTVQQMLENPELFTGAQHMMYKDLGGWDATMMAGALDPLIFTFSTPLRMKLPGRELPPDSIFQFDESEVMTVEDYDTIIEKGCGAFFFKELLPRIEAGAGGSFYGKWKMMFKLIGRALGMKKEIRYWQKLGVPTLVGAWASPPFEMFSVARSLTQFTADLYRRPEKVIAAMDAALPGVIADALRSVQATGVRCVYIGAARGAGTFISMPQFERFYFPWLKKMVEELAAKDTISLLHFDADWTLDLPYLEQLPRGRCILDLDGTTDIFKAKSMLGDHMCIMGDVPATLFTLGTPDEVKSYCQKLIDVVGKGGGFILSSGCEIPHEARFENIKAMIDTAKTYQLSKN